jgi:hypothetical protein
MELDMITYKDSRGGKSQEVGTGEGKGKNFELATQENCHSGDSDDVCSF